MTSPTPHEMRSLLVPERLTNIVDIGASPIEGEQPYHILRDAGACRLIGFEPDPKAFDLLQPMRSANETYLPFALGDGREHTLHLTNAPGMNSLLKPNKEMLSLFHDFPAWAEVTGTKTMSTRTLDSVTEVQDMDFLHIDVQGSERSVFTHGREKIRDAVVIQTEVSFVPLYENQPTYGDINRILTNMGFMLHTFHQPFTRALAPMDRESGLLAPPKQIVELDAIYVRDLRDLPELSDEKLKHLAIVAHCCYESVDLAYLAMTKLDARNGTSLCAQYERMCVQP